MMPHPGQHGSPTPDALLGEGGYQHLRGGVFYERF